MKSRVHAGVARRGAILLGVAGAAVSPALAQDNATVVELKPLVVTGERIERTIFDTASSVSVVTDEDLKKKVDVKTVQEAIKDLPNVFYSGTVGAPVIRGQDTQGPNSGAGAFFSGTVPRASVNVDGHYLGYSDYVFGATSVWDVDSIEAFRGPQTSSQGANSIAGAIVVNTKDPTFDWEGAALAQVGNLSSRRAAAALSGPLSQDVAARVALDVNRRDTFVDYTNPAFLKGDSDQDFAALNGRVKLLALPESIPGLETKLTLSLNQTNRPTSEAVFAPFDKYESRATSMPSWEQDTRTAITDINYDFGNGLRLYNQSQLSSSDIDRVLAPVTNGSAMIDQRNGSHESRLAFGDAGDMVSGVAGVRYERTLSDEVLLLRGTSTYSDTKSNLGLYTEVSVRPLERVTVTGGLRYQRDRVQRSGTSSFATEVLDYDEVFDAILPRLSLAYEVTPAFTAGVLVNKGYNPGGVSLNLQTGKYAAFDPETVWNYELFGRASLLDDRLFLNANLFYSDFSDAQRYVQVSIPELVGQSITVNAEKARSYGLELGVDYQILDSLKANASVGLLHTEITKFTNAIANYEGSEFGRAPSHMISVGLDWAITPELTVGGDVKYTGGYYSSDENDAATKIDSYTTANLRANYQLHDNFNVFAYVNNVFDSADPTFMSYNRSVGGIEATVQPPREFGLGVRATF